MRHKFLRRFALQRSPSKEEALEKMRQWGAESVSAMIHILEDRSLAPDKREAAALVLAGFRPRSAVAPLIEALSEGHPKLSWACMWALTSIGSRRHARRLIAIARGNCPLPARHEAIYTLWHLHEYRAESLFIRIADAVDSEEEYTRDMATEALGNSASRPSSQRALAERLFDPSVSIRYAALCACSTLFPQPYSFPSFLRRAIEAKLADPERVDDNRGIAELASRLLGLG